MESVGRLVGALHANQAQVLVRRISSWENAKTLAQVGVDLVSVVHDERDAATDPNAE